MWKKRAATVLAGVTWAAAGTQAMPGLPYWMSAPGMMFALAVAVSATAYLAMHCYQRPLGEAYELGYERGRRDAMRAANRSSLAPIRRASAGVSQSNREFANR